jgi:hypothetical protein
MQSSLCVSERWHLNCVAGLSVAYLVTLFTVLFFVALGFELRTSPLLDACSSAWTNACSPFCSDYFGDRILLLTQAVLDCDPLILSVLPLLEDRCAPPRPDIGWDGVLQTFCPDWSQMLILLISASQWRYGGMKNCLAYYLKKENFLILLVRVLYLSFRICLLGP